MGYGLVIIKLLTRIGCRFFLKHLRRNVNRSELVGNGFVVYLDMFSESVDDLA